MTTFYSRLVLLGVLVLGSQSLVALAETRAPGRIEVPPVPDKLRVEDGHVVFLEGHAIGTQNFICLATGTNQFAWRFTGPQATLFLNTRKGLRQQLTTHFLSANPGENGLARPTWQDSSDSSVVWGRVKDSSSDAEYVEPGAIPWLLLEAAGARLGPTHGHTLAQTTFIQRLNTHGGLMPATGCSEQAHIGAVQLVPYEADYFFYKAERRGNAGVER